MLRLGLAPHSTPEIPGRGTMKIRQRIAALVVAVLSVTGLVLIGSIAQSETAAASPLLGQHTVVSKCTDGTFVGQFKYTYTITFKSYDAPNKMTTYRFQLDSSFYTGNAGAGGRPSAWVTYANGLSGGWLNATHGAAASTANADVVWPLGTALSPSSGRVNGLAGVSWTGTDIKFGGLAASEDLMRITWPSHTACEFNINLALPDGPITGVDFLEDHCGTPGAPDYFGIDLDYDVQHVSGQIYTVTVDSLLTHTVRSGAGTGTQPYEKLSIWVDGEVRIDGSVVSAKDRSLNNQNLNAFPRPFALIGETSTDEDWTPKTPPFDTLWKGVSFEWAGGNSGMKPQIMVEATRYDFGTPCVVHRRMGEDFTVAGQTFANARTFSFDNCQGGTGSITITGNYTWDANSELVRINSITIKNNSPQRITLPALVGGVTPNPQWRQDSGPPNNVYTQMGGADSAPYRIWGPNETRALDITDPAKWTAIAGGLDISTPGGTNRWYIDGLPVMDITAKAWNLSGVIWSECIAARPGLTNMEANSARI